MNITRKQLITETDIGITILLRPLNEQYKEDENKCWEEVKDKRGREEKVNRNSEGNEVRDVERKRL